MNIYSVALEGLQAARGSVEKSAKRLASSVEPTEIVELLSAKEQFQLNVRAIRTADEMQKSLLDVLA